MKLLKIAFLFICITSFAQETKVGTVDVEYILSQMPELADVQKAIEEYGKGLDAELGKKFEAYNALVKDYQDNEVSLTIAQKKVRQDSILSSENDITKYQENGSKLIALKRDELLNPLYNKIGVSLEKIAEAQGYTQVLRRDNTLVYIDNRFDLTMAILNDMGIEVKQEE